MNGNTDNDSTRRQATFAALDVVTTATAGFAIGRESAGGGNTVRFGFSTVRTFEGSDFRSGFCDSTLEDRRR
jgi:hypothetical protein